MNEVEKSVLACNLSIIFQQVLSAKFKLNRDGVLLIILWH